MHAPITALYAGLLAILVVGLALRVVRGRQVNTIGIGDGGNPDLLARIRVHSNAVENVPIALILMLLLELNGSSPGLLHGLGIALVVARLGHAQGLSQSSGTTPGRFLGILTTWIVILIAAVANIF